MAVYYVDSVSGDDGNSGLSPELAWASLTQASTISYTAGDSVLLKCGCTFTDTFTSAAKGTVNNPITFSKYGSGSNPIIDGSALLACVFFTANSDHWYVADLEICNAYGHLDQGTIQDGTGIRFDGGTHTVENCELHHSADQNTQNYTATVTYKNCHIHHGADDGISVHSGRVIAQNCLFENNNQQFGSEKGGFIEAYDCIFHGGAFVQDQMMSDPTVEMIVERCIFYPTAHTSSPHGIVGSGVMRYCVWDFRDATANVRLILGAAASQYGGATDIQLENCTFYGWGNGRTNGRIIATAGAIRLKNCVFDKTYGIISAGGTIDATNCNFYNVTTKTLTSNTGEISGNPLLVDPNNGDFSLGVGSPCIDAGVDLGQTQDYQKNNIIGPPDVGAFEYQAWVTATNAGDHVALSWTDNATGEDSWYIERWID